MAPDLALAREVEGALAGCRDTEGGLNVEPMTDTRTAQEVEAALTGASVRHFLAREQLSRPGPAAPLRPLCQIPRETRAVQLGWEIFAGHLRDLQRPAPTIYINCIACAELARDRGP